jgi:hypothetical protein
VTTAGAATLPAPVAAVCATFLDLAPDGLVTGLYLRGGVGFGEWVPGRSDVDFVATLSGRPGAGDLVGLRAAHASVATAHPDVPFDGMHVLAEDLAADPRTLPGVPCILHGHWEPEGTLDPEVTWHELAWHGVTVTGPSLASLDVWTDRRFLASFTRDNLDTYWRGHSEGLALRPPEGRSEWACEWCVLGVARLHHLLLTGEMTTKNGAGRWGLDHYPERFHRVLREALRIRNGGSAEYLDDDESRGADTAAFTAYVVERGTSGG